MSTVGKIFVVINLVLSLVVLGSMAALLNASKQTKETVAALEQQKADLTTQLAEARSQFEARQRNLETDKRNLETAKEDAEVAREAAERAAQKLEQDNQQLRGDLGKITASLQLLQGDLSAKEQRNRELQEIADGAREEAASAREAQRQAEMTQRDVEDQLAAAQGEIETLQTDLVAARESGRQSEMLLEVAINSGFDPTSVMAMPAIDAVVADVDTDYGFVILDKGKKHNVQKGFVFDVVRQGSFMGRVRVDEVHDDYATASIVLRKGDIRRFDRATTRL